MHPNRVARSTGAIFAVIVMVIAGLSDRAGASELITWTDGTRITDIEVVRAPSLILAGSDPQFLDPTEGWRRLQSAVRDGARQVAGRFSGPNPLALRVDVLEFFGNPSLTGTKYYLQVRYTVSTPSGEEVVRSKRRYFSQGRSAVGLREATDLIAYRIRQDLVSWIGKRRCPDDVCSPDRSGTVVATATPEPEPVPVLPEPVIAEPEVDPVEAPVVATPEPVEPPATAVAIAPDAESLPATATPTAPLSVDPAPRRSIVSRLLTGILGDGDDAPADPPAVAAASDIAPGPDVVAEEPDTTLIASTRPRARPVVMPTRVTEVEAKPALPPAPAPKPAEDTSVEVARLPEIVPPAPVVEEPEVVVEPPSVSTPVEPRIVPGTEDEPPVPEIATPTPAPVEPEVASLPPAPRPPRDTTAAPSEPDTALPSLATAKWVGSTDVELSDRKRRGSWLQTDMVTIESRGWVTDEESGTTREMTLVPAGKTRTRVGEMSREAMESLGLVPGQRAVVSVYLRRN